MTARPPIKTPAKTSIADLAQDLPDDFDDIAAFSPDAPAPAAAVATPTLAPDDLAGAIALKRSLPRRIVDRFRRGASTAIVIHAPSSDWCHPLHQAATTLLGRGLSVHFSATTDNPTLRGGLLYFVRDAGDSRGRPDATGDSLTTCLSTGGSAVGIAVDPSWLPAPLIAAADAFIDVAPLRGRDLSRIIRVTTRCTRCPRVDDGLASSLSPSQIALGVRANSTPTACLRRLRRIAARSLTTDVAIDAPRLEDLAGYGEAFDWGLALKRDIEARRADPSAVSLDTITRSLLLAGPPGTGKTLFAAALARSCGIPLITTSYADWQAGDAHLGIVMGNLRAVFAAARTAARASNVGAILFIDELDSLPSRAGGSHLNLYLAAVSNALLTLAQRSPARRGVVLIGASNFPERIDGALLRPDRIHPTVVLNPPNTADFAAMLRTHIGGDLPDADLVALARLAPGRTGADAAQLVRDARQTARSAGRPLTFDDLLSQVMPVETRPPAQLARIARHEAAHAVIGHALGVQRLESVTLSAPGVDGIARFSRYADTQMTRAVIDAVVVTALSGRAFDQADGAADAGSRSDLTNATTLLAGLHRSFGLGDSLVAFGGPDDVADSLRFDPDLRATVEADLQRLYARAQAMVAERRNEIERVAAALLRRRFLSGDDVRRLLKRVRRGEATRRVKGRPS